MTGRLSGKIALVAGGTGATGVGIVRSFLLEDATVIVPSESSDEVKWLRAYVSDITKGKLVTLLTDLPDFNKATELAEDIMQGYPQLDLVVAAFDSCWLSPSLTDVTLLDWEKAIGNSVTPFFICARTLLHIMKAARYGTYVSICDTDALERKPYSSLSYIAAVTQLEMAQIFAEEVRDCHVRYYHLFTNNIVTRDMPPGLAGRTGWLTPEAVGERITGIFCGEVDDTHAVFQYCIGKPFRFLPPVLNKRP